MIDKELHRPRNEMSVFLMGIAIEAESYINYIYLYQILNVRFEVITYTAVFKKGVHIILTKVNVKYTTMIEKC